MRQDQVRSILNHKPLAAGVVLLIAVLTVNSWLALRRTRELFENSARVAHTHEVLAQLERVTAMLTDAETGQRGYIITGLDEYLEPYDAARAQYEEAFDRLESLTADNPTQLASIARIRELATRRLAVLRQNLEKRDSGGFEAAREGIRSGEGRRLAREIRALVDEMRQHEFDLLRDREALNDGTYRRATASALIAAAVGLAAVTAFLYLFSRHLRSVSGAAAEIHRQRELLQATLSSIGDGVIATDASGQVTFLNNVAQDLTGWREEEAAGQSLDHVFRIVNEQTRQPVDNPALRAIREGRVMGLANHTILVSRNGSEWPIDDSAAPIRTIAGQVAGAILVFREIGERRRQERALREADVRKDEFLATLAHELRTPLAPLSNAVQIWPIVANDPAEMERLREMMERQVRQLTRLVDDLLDVSRITRGRIQLRKEPVDLRSILTGAIESLQHFIDGCGHRLTVELPPEPLVVDGDAARLTQVFGNILHNAAKYTGRGGRIAVFAEMRDGSAIVRIRDNGPGIPADMLKRVFEMFQQVDQTLDRAHGGLGIGLTLVQRLVVLHGGSIAAHSDGPGCGTEFTVTLPVVTGPRTDVRRFSSSRRVPQAESVPSLRVLVVDDVHASAATLAMMLQSVGQEVAMVHNGPAALEWIGAHRPDVVFLDIAMAGMDGYEVARRIRKRPELRDVFLVALTGYGRDSDRQQALEAGFDHHLTKPASIDVLVQLLTTRSPAGSERSPAESGA